MTRVFRGVFLIYALFELAAGVGNLTVSQAGMNEMLAAEAIADPAGMVLPRLFGNAVVGMALVSLLAVFLKDRLALMGISALMIVFNGLATYIPLSTPGLPDAFSIGAYVHGAFTLIFAFMAYTYYQQKADD